MRERSFLQARRAMRSGNLTDPTILRIAPQPLPSEMHVTPPSQLIQYQHDKMGGQPISVMLGAGPFTLDTDVLFEPLDALMEAARTERPDVLILVSGIAWLVTFGLPERGLGIDLVHLWHWHRSSVPSSTPNTHSSKSETSMKHQSICSAVKSPLVSLFSRNLVLVVRLFSYRA